MRITAWTVAVVLAAIHAWSARYFVNPDGVSYIDLSDDYLAGHWRSAVNGYWSPLYPMLLAAVRKIVNPSPFNEALTVHAFNAITFLASLAAFEVMLAELRKRQRFTAELEPAAKSLLSLRSPLGLACAYLLFFFGGLCLIRISPVTPDMMIAVWAYLIAATMLRLRRTVNSTATLMPLGAVLGAAYLTKAVMFPIGILVLVVLLTLRPKGTTSFSTSLIAVIVFAIVVLPQVYSVSMKSGRLSFGSVGSIAYARYVNKYPKFWTGQPQGSGTPAHSIGPMATSPPVYSFAMNEEHRSYPLWDEPAHWYAGMTPHFDIRDQVAATSLALRVYAGVLGKVLLPLLLVLLSVRRKTNPTTTVLVCLSVTVFVIYGSVHAEPRLIAPWFVIGALAFLSGSTVVPSSKRRSAAIAGVYLITAVCLIAVVIQTARSINPERDEAGFNSAVNSQFLVAQKVSALGIGRGSKVMLVGDESDIYWARLAGVQVAYQVLLSDAPAYWALSENSRAVLNEEVAQRGASALVASWTNPPSSSTGWIRVSDRNYFILRLPDSTSRANAR